MNRFTEPPGLPPRFAELPKDWQHQDSLGSYLLAVAEIGAAVKRGAPLPRYFHSIRCACEACGDHTSGKE